jgi:hypothetical protein
MGVQKIVRIVVLMLLVSGVMGGLLISHDLGQPKGRPLSISTNTTAATPQSCTVQTLLDTSNCDQTLERLQKRLPGMCQGCCKTFLERIRVQRRRSA